MKPNQLVDRLAAIRHADVTPAVKQRIADAAQYIDAAATNQMRVETLNESVLAFTVTVYQSGADGRLAFVDDRTWRLLIAAPWGRAGWRYWKLRAWEGEILRKILFLRAEARRAAPLFDYNSEARTWHLNIGQYPALADGMEYWRRRPIALDEFVLYADDYRDRARTRADRRR